MNKDTEIINLLLEVQEKYGYLPREEMIRISKEKNIPGTRLYGVATFYSQFRLSKPGRHTVAICSGTACHVKGFESLLNHLENLLGIKNGQTTKDGRITLKTVNCIGACAKAPAMMVDGIVYGELTKNKIKKIVDGLQ